MLEREDMVKNMIYHPRETTVSVFSAFEELFELSNITRTSYTQHQGLNISYVIINRTSKFSLVIIKWNLMLSVQKTFVGFKQFLGLCTMNYERKQTSMFRMWAYTMQIWYAMYW